MKLKVIDEFGVVEYTCSELSKEFFEDLHHFAAQEKLLNLSQIALDGNTYFNEQQLKDIQKELECIHKHEIEKETLKQFDDCIIKAIELCPYSYLTIQYQ